jgi:hypothetical protein
MEVVAATEVKNCSLPERTRVKNCNGLMAAGPVLKSSRLARNKRLGGIAEAGGVIKSAAELGDSLSA